MGMASEIATEVTIKAIVKEIEAAMGDPNNSHEVQQAYRKIGRFALTQFDYTWPDWATKYERQFAERSEAYDEYMKLKRLLRSALAGASVEQFDATIDSMAHCFGRMAESEREELG